MTESDWFHTARILQTHALRGPVAVLLDAAYCAYAPHGIVRALGALEPLLDKLVVLVAWSASKTFTQYGLRVGCLAGVVPEWGERQRWQRALGYACRGTWSTCNRGGMAAVTRLLVDPEFSTRVSVERGAILDRLGGRVSVFNELARAAGLRFPRYDGGFFVTVFNDDPSRTAAKMRADGVYVVPLEEGLRIALCSIATADVPKVVQALVRASST